MITPTTREPCRICGMPKTNPTPHAIYCDDCASLIRAVREKFGYKTRRPNERIMAYAKVLEYKYGPNEQGVSKLERRGTRIDEKYGLKGDDERTKAITLDEQERSLRPYRSWTDTDLHAQILSFSEQIRGMRAELDYRHYDSVQKEKENRGVTNNFKPQSLPQEQGSEPTTGEDTMNRIIEKTKRFLGIKKEADNNKKPTDEGVRLRKDGQPDLRGRTKRRQRTENECGGKFKNHKWKETYTLPNGKTDSRYHESCMRCGTLRGEQ